MSKSNKNYRKDNHHIENLPLLLELAYTVVYLAVSSLVMLLMSSYILPLPKYAGEGNDVTVL